MATKTMPKAKKTLSLTDKSTGSTKSQKSANSNGIKGSFYEKNKHLIGSLSANVTDLSSNKEHLPKTPVITKKTVIFQVSEKEVKNSFYSKAKHLIGSVDSGVTDLSINKKYLEGFGRSKNEGNR